MKPQGKEFDGSSSLFETHQLLKTIAGYDIWLTKFKPINHEHRNFIELLLQTLCKVGICCAISGIYSAYIAGVFSSHFAVTLCVTKCNSTILNPLLGKRQKCMIGTFTFKLNEEVDNHNYIFYEITYEVISVSFQIIAIDTSIEWGSHFSLNFVEFILYYLGLLRFKMYAIVAVPFYKPIILYLQYHRAVSEVWTTDFLCDLVSTNLKRYSHRLSVIVPSDVPADIFYVLVNRRLSNVRLRMRCFISHSMLINLH